MKLFVECFCFVFATQKFGCETSDLGLRNDYSKTILYHAYLRHFFSFDDRSKCHVSFKVTGDCKPIRLLWTIIRPNSHICKSAGFHIRALRHPAGTYIRPDWDGRRTLPFPYWLRELIRLGFYQSLSQEYDITQLSWKCCLHQLCTTAKLPTVLFCQSYSTHRNNWSFENKPIAFNFCCTTLYVTVILQNILPLLLMLLLLVIVHKTWYYY